MSTRATVWINNESTGEERFLYHHCDGYMLDEELDPILKELEPEEWTVDNIVNEILEKHEDYGRHKVDGVGWDSEYVYKIDVRKKTLEKFECGIEDTEQGDRKDEKTQEKYLKNTYKYSSAVIDDPATRAQIIKIQLLELIKYACGCIERGVVDHDEADKIQEIFKIIHRK